jgi:hypothetical protein
LRRRICRRDAHRRHICHAASKLPLLLFGQGT